MTSPYETFFSRDGHQISSEDDEPLPNNPPLEYQPNTISPHELWADRFNILSNPSWTTFPDQSALETDDLTPDFTTGLDTGPIYDVGLDTRLFVSEVDNYASLLSQESSDQFSHADNPVIAPNNNSKSLTAVDGMTTSSMKTSSGKHNDQNSSISRVAFTCRELFREIGEACELKETVISRMTRLLKRSGTSQKSPLTHDDLNDEFEQFRVWARNLGVFASDQASLDYRLREASDVRDGIIALLRSLLADLDGVFFLLYQDREVNGDTDTDSSEDTASDSDGSETRDPLGRSAYEFQARLQRITSTVNKLMQLAEAIRASNSSARISKAANYVHWEGGINMTEQFETKYLPFLLEQRYKVKSTLVDRLVKAISARRRRFEYQNKHQQRLAYPGDYEFASMKANASSGPRRVLALRTTPDQPKFSPTATHLMNKSGSNVLTVATTFKKLQIKHTAPSTIVSAATKTMAGNVEFPPPPRIPAKATHFQCPYCCILMPERKFLAGKGTFSKSLWAKHVVADLQPFVCLEDECETPHIMLETHDDWLNHQRWEHSMEWWCENDETGHEPLRFDTANFYIEHAEQVHKQPHESAVKQASIAGRPSLFPFQACPFCDYDAATSDHSEKRLEDGDLSQSLKAQSDLQKHIADELTNLFMIALPERDDIRDIETDTERPAAKGSTIRALDDISLSFANTDDLSRNSRSHAEETWNVRFPLEFDLSPDPYVTKEELYEIDDWEDVWTSPQLQECVRSTYTGFEHDGKLQEMLAVATKEKEAGDEPEIELWIPSVMINGESIVRGRRLPRGTKSYYEIEAILGGNPDGMAPTIAFEGPDTDDFSPLVNNESTYRQDGKRNYANFFVPPELRNPRSRDREFID